MRVYIDVFHDIIFYYSLTVTQTLTFGHIKWTLDDTLTCSFLDIVFGQYFRQGLGKIIHQKWKMSPSSPVFLGNLGHGVMSISWKMRGWGVKSRYVQDNILCFIDIIYRDYTRNYDIQSFYLPRCRCDFWNINFILKSQIVGCIPFRYFRIMLWGRGVNRKIHIIMWLRDKA